MKEKMSNDKNGSKTLFVFPRWLDEILPVAGMVLGLAPVYITLR